MAAVKPFGPVVPVMLRSSFYFISQIFKAVGQDCYETTVFLTPRVTMDLQFLHDTLDQYNGYPIFANKIGFCLNSALEEGDLKKAMSSDIKAVAYNPYLTSYHPSGRSVPELAFHRSQNQINPSRLFIVHLPSREPGLKPSPEKVVCQ